MRGQLVIIVLFQVMTACGPGVAEGPLPIVEGTDSNVGTGSSTDSGDTETDEADTETEDSETEDSETEDSETEDSETEDTLVSHGDSDPDEDWCEEFLFQDDTVITAQELGAEGAFVAISNDCVLLRSPEDNGVRTTVVFLSSEVEAPHETKRVETVSDLLPLAITCYEDPMLDDRIAVILMSGNDGITLLEASFDRDEMVPLGETELLENVPLTRVARLLRTSGNGINRLCAFGEGLFCLDMSSDDGEWVEEIPPEPGVRFNDVGVMEQGDEWLLLAVGGDGRIDVGGREGWQTLPSVTDAELFAVSTLNEQLVAAGEGGVFVYGTLEAMEEALLLDDDVVSLNFWSDYPFKGVTRNGTVFRGRIEDEGLRLCPVESLPGPLLDSLSIGCGSSENFLILTPQALIGEYGCRMLVVI